MKKIRKLLQSAVSILMAFVLVFAMGCEGCSKDSSSSGSSNVVIKPAPEKPAPTFELSQTQINCIVGDVDKLSPKSLPNIGEASLTWRSEDSRIVTVDSKGNIEAISEGTARIVATYGNITAECMVNVSWDNELPQIVAPVGPSDKFSIVVGQDYTFAPTIRYRDKIYNDAKLTVSVEDSAVVSLDETTSTITGATKGSSVVTISGTWRNWGMLSDGTQKELKASFNVAVSDNVTLDVISDSLVGDQVIIYTQANTFANKEDQPTSCNFIPKAQVNDNPVVDATSAPSDFSVTISDTDLVSYNETNNTLQSKIYGDTIAIINYNYDGITYVKQIFVHLERPTATFARELDYFSSIQGTFRDEEDGFKVKTLKEIVYGEDDVTVETAFADGEEVQVEASTGAVLGVTTPSDKAYDVVIRIGTDVEQYDITTKVYGQYVYEPTDLDVFVRSAASPELDIYVELGRDLDLSDYVKPDHFADIDTSNANDPNSGIRPNHKWMSNNRLAKGFMGTFNGNGKSLMNYTQTGSYGFFEALYDATIKNVAFVNCALDNSTFLASFANNTTMENVYIKLTRMKKSTNYWPVAVVSQYASPAGSYTNVFIDLEDVNASMGLGEARGRYYWETYSAFLTFPLANKTQPKFNNCLIISKAPVSAMGYIDDTNAVDSPRIVVAENMSETDREALRQEMWNSQTEAEKNYLKNRYDAKYKGNTTLYPNPLNFEDPSLVLEYYNNAYLSSYNNDVTQASNVGKVVGVRSYNTSSDMQGDATIRDYIANFSSEFWTIVDGQLTWGKHPANLVDGDIFLDVGELAGKQVSGSDLSPNPLKGNVEGDTVEIGALSCFGYIFKGWKNNANGELLKKVDGEDKWTLVYSGKATILVAIWEKDPNVQVDSGNK